MGVVMKVLIVEDEVKIAKSLEKGLVSEGYVVDVAYNSDTAHVMVQSSDYDMVLLDWMIPGEHAGPALVQRWREQGRDMPILMLTARTTIGDRVQGLDAGADDYLPKPFSFDELLARVRALLRRPKKHQGAVIRAGTLTLDTTAKQLRQGSKEVHVTAKEFQLLEYLMRHKGEVISKDQLLDHVWADESRVQHNTVETFVANVRKKLQHGERAIQTVRGHGYKVG
jgi:DNA-binding response OmpR family regulator